MERRFEKTVWSAEKGRELKVHFEERVSRQPWSSIKLEFLIAAKRARMSLSSNL